MLWEPPVFTQDTVTSEEVFIIYHSYWIEDVSPNDEIAQTSQLHARNESASVSWRTFPKSA